MSWENLKKKIFGKSSADDEQGQIQPVQDQGDQEADLTQGPSQ
jgi:hypothetical protein